MYSTRTEKRSRKLRDIWMGQGYVLRVEFYGYQPHLFFYYISKIKLSSGEVYGTHFFRKKQESGKKIKKFGSFFLEKINFNRLKLLKIDRFEDVLIRYPFKTPIRLFFAEKNLRKFSKIFNFIPSKTHFLHFFEVIEIHLPRPPKSKTTKVLGPPPNNPATDIFSYQTFYCTFFGAKTYLIVS